MAGVHATIAPSSLDVIVKCHAYVQMAAPFKDDPPTEEQLEGDAGHWVALQYASGVEVPVGTMTPQGLVVDADMVEGAELWRDTVGLHGVAEMPVACPRVHPTECWGTPDYWRADMIERVLHVWDYKFGHLYVDAFENWQLGAGYAPGILDSLGIDGHAEQDWQVVIGIVQPRNYHPSGHVRKWGPFPATDLRAMVNIARMAAERSLMPNPEATAGTHCIYCPARHECPTLQRAAMSVVHYSGTMDRVNMPAGALAVELRILDEAAKVLDARRTGLKEQALSRIRRGERVPGCSAEHGEGRLTWKVPAAEVFVLGDMLGVDLRKDAEPITPTQAIKKKVDAGVISGYAFRPPKAATLVFDSTTEARKVFGANAK